MFLLAIPRAIRNRFALPTTAEFLHSRFPLVAAQITTWTKGSSGMLLYDALSLGTRQPLVTAVLLEGVVPFLYASQKFWLIQWGMLVVPVEEISYSEGAGPLPMATRDSPSKPVASHIDTRHGLRATLP